MAVDSSLLNNLYNRLGVSSTEVEPTPVPEDPSIAEQAYGKFEKLPIGAQIVAGVAPGTGHAIAAYETPMFAGETKEALEEGNIPRMLGMGAMTGLSALGMIPGLGIPIRGAKAGIKAATKILDDKVFTNIPKVDVTKSTKEVLDINTDDILNWKATNEGSGYREISGENLEKLQQSVRDIKTGNKSVEAHKKTVQELKPIKEISADDWDKSIKKNIPTEKEIAFSLRPGKGKLFDKDFNELEGGILYANRAIEEGATTTSRLDINAYQDFDKWVATLTPSGGGKIYGRSAYLTDVKFTPSTKRAMKTGTGEATKEPFGVMKGGWKNHNPDELIKKVKDLIDDPEWVQVGYDPRRHGHFYTRGKFNQAGKEIEAVTPIESASEVIQVGPLVLAKNPVFGDAMVYKEGGSVVERNPYTHNMKAI